MGRRYKKTVWVNNEPIAEYIGSDDPAEDEEAARAALRAAGRDITSRPLLGRILSQAAAFSYVAHELYKQLLGHPIGTPGARTRPLVASPFAVNAAFSVELYLKALHVADCGRAPRGHKLLELFDALSPARQQELQAECAKYAASYGEGTTTPFRDLLSMLNDAFETWRYVHETSTSGPIHLKQTVLTMHALNDVCARLPQS